MTCHLGYTLHHAIFTILHVSIIVWLVRVTRKRARDRAAILRGILCTFVVLFGLYHVVMGAVCSSTSISEALRRRFPTYPLLRVRLMLMWARQMMLALVSRFIDEAKGIRRWVKIVAGDGTLLLSTVLLLIWYLDDCAVERLRAIRQCVMLSMVLSSLFILSSLRSRALVLSPLIGVPASLLRSHFNLDDEGRVLPHTPADEVDPHWSAPLHFLLVDMVFLICSAALSQAVIARLRSEPGLSAAPLIDLLKPAGSVWFAFPPLVCIVFYNLNSLDTLIFLDPLRWIQGRLLGGIDAAEQAAPPPGAVLLFVLSLIPVFVLLYLLFLDMKPGAVARSPDCSLAMTVPASTHGERCTDQKSL